MLPSGLRSPRRRFFPDARPGPKPRPRPQPEEDIRGPRAPIEIPAPAKLSTAKKVLIATPVAATAGLLLWFFMFRRGNPLLTIPPVDQAREALRGIDRQRESLPAGDLAEQTANVVRRFIAGNFGIAAPQRTTEEFLHSLTTTQPLPAAASCGTAPGIPDHLRQG